MSKPNTTEMDQQLADLAHLVGKTEAKQAMKDVLTSDPPVPPPKRRPRDSNSRRKFQKLKGLRYR